MPRIANGRDARAPRVVVKEGREWKSQADYTSYVSDGKFGNRLTKAHQRPRRARRLR